MSGIVEESTSGSPLFFRMGNSLESGRLLHNQSTSSFSSPKPDVCLKLLGIHALNGSCTRPSSMRMIPPILTSAVCLRPATTCTSIPRFRKWPAKLFSRLSGVISTLSFGLSTTRMDAMRPSVSERILDRLFSTNLNLRTNYVEFIAPTTYTCETVRGIFGGLYAVGVVGAQSDPSSFLLAYPNTPVLLKIHSYYITFEISSKLAADILETGTWVFRPNDCRRTPSPRTVSSNLDIYVITKAKITLTHIMSTGTGEHSQFKQ